MARALRQCRYGHNNADSAARLARSASAARLGAEAAGLEATDDRRGAADSGPPRTDAQAHTRAARPHPGPAGPGGRGVRLRRRCLDRRAGRGGPGAGVRGALPPGPRQLAPAGGRLERPATHPPRDPAGRGGHRGLVRRALAGPKKGADEQGRVILWVDESGFYLLPAAVRTYAPRGRTPVLRVPLSRDHLSVISGLSPDGRLVLMAQERALTGADVARFLRHLLEIIPDPLLIIWDGGPIHRAQPVRDLLAEVGPGRLRVEPLPGYAPDLNPDEGIRSHLKHIELRNVCCHRLAQLREALRDATIRLCAKPAVIRGCVREAGYHV